MGCGYILAWVGLCGKETNGNDFCEEHSKSTCESCGEQATHECDQTGQFVCGAPLCNKCTHNVHPEGHNGGVGFNQQDFPEGVERHCKKSEMKYAPWYVSKNSLDKWKDANGIAREVEVTLTGRRNQEV